jgi:hypothetical protein
MMRSFQSCAAGARADDDHVIALNHAENLSPAIGWGEPVPRVILSA